MKNRLTSAFIFLAVSAFAQDTKKDTVKTGSLEDYGMRIYDPRIGRAMSTEPKDLPQNNPYNFEEVRKDSTAVKQPATEPKQKVAKK
ncbi:MAG: hypothetical protein H0V01_10765 [Bacteroidetes bacterium]|nr:hypothetical protein [Bacteroidota bacterium]HET6243843.1 hypothetical protein [Bacteroidia bacterium]